MIVNARLVDDGVALTNGTGLQAAHVNVTSIGTEGGVGSFVVWECYVMVIVVFGSARAIICGVGFE